MEMQTDNPYSDLPFSHYHNFGLLRHYIVRDKSSGYGARIWIDTDFWVDGKGSEDVFFRVREFLNETSVWGGCDKKLHRFHSSHERNHFERNVTAYSWEFDDNGLEVAISWLKSEGYTEGFDLNSYRFSR